MSPTTLLSRAAVVLALLVPTAAHAAPPEGCVGLPSVPQAFVCVTQWSPENAVPGVSPGPGQTVTVPEFCVFDCFGPTPVTVPDFVVSQGSGVIAVVTYNGSTYTVAVPPTGDVYRTVEQAERTISDTVAAVLGVVGNVTAQPPGTFDAVATIDCYGCATATGSLSGTFSGVINGHVYQQTGMAAAFSLTRVSGTSCGQATTAVGSMWIGGEITSLTWTQVGPTVQLTFTGGFYGSGLARYAPTSAPCGGVGSVAIDGAMATS